MAGEDLAADRERSEALIEASRRLAKEPRAEGYDLETGLGATLIEVMSYAVTADGRNTSASFMTASAREALRQEGLIQMGLGPEPVEPRGAKA